MKNKYIMFYKYQGVLKHQVFFNGYDIEKKNEILFSIRNYLNKHSYNFVKKSLEI